ncbi:hypothetical protein WA158_000460 [Blastocystis sp. Blastoise]
MLSFDAEGMRACVKYKILKKYIKQFAGNKGDDDNSDKEKEETDKKEEDSNQVEQPTEEKDMRTPQDVVSLEGNKSFILFMETVNEDLIAINQYYNKEMTDIRHEYDVLYDRVKHHLTTKHFFSFCRKNPLPNEIFNLYGRMELLKKFASLNYSGLRKIIKKMHKMTGSNAGEGFMKLVVSSPFYDIQEQEDLSDMIQTLYYLSRTSISSSKSKVRNSDSIDPMETLMEQIKEKKLTENTDLKSLCMTKLEQANKTHKGQEQLRDMVFRGKRLFKSQLPIRHGQKKSEGEEEDIYKDVMLVQMSLLPISSEMDEQEIVFKEGYLLRRNVLEEGWQARYYIVTNRRICYFTTINGALRRTIEFPRLSRFYSMSSRQYPLCLFLEDKSDQFFWLACEDKKEIEEYRQIISQFAHNTNSLYKENTVVKTVRSFSYLNESIQGLSACDKPSELWFLLLRLEKLLIKKKLTYIEVTKLVEVIQELFATRPDVWNNTLTFMVITIITNYNNDLGVKLQGKIEIKDEELVPTNVNINNIYKFERQIGSGHFSTVQLAVSKIRDTSIDNDDEGVHHVAVKCINAYQLDEYDKVALKKEVSNMIRLRGHPNIINIYGFYTDGVKYYIVMELAQGGRLFDHIVKQEKFSEEDARVIMKTVTKAVHYCHERNIIHRDLKPQNILLSDPNKLDSVKLSDFGFASHFDTSRGYLRTALGTPGYTAPEILSDSPTYNEKVDCWSLGVITYILLCGYPPFPSNNEVQRLKCIRKGIYTFDSPYWDNISDNAKEFICNTICVDIDKRMNTQQMLEHPWLVTELSSSPLSPFFSRENSNIFKNEDKHSDLVTPEGPSAAYKNINININQETKNKEIYVSLQAINCYDSNLDDTTVKATIPPYTVFTVENEDYTPLNTYIYISPSTLTSLQINPLFNRIPLFETRESDSHGNSIASVVASTQYQYTSIPITAFLYTYIQNDTSLPVYSRPLNIFPSDDRSIYTHKHFINTVPISYGMTLAIDSICETNGEIWGLLHSLMYKTFGLQAYPFVWIYISPSTTNNTINKNTNTTTTIFVKDKAIDSKLTSLYQSYIQDHPELDPMTQKNTIMNNISHVNITHNIDTIDITSIHNNTIENTVDNNNNANINNNT